MSQLRKPLPVRLIVLVALLSSSLAHAQHRKGEGEVEIITKSLGDGTAGTVQDGTCACATRCQANPNERNAMAPLGDRMMFASENRIWSTPMNARTEPEVTRFAGDASGTAGTVNGGALTAQFEQINSIIGDESGRLFVGQGNGAIREVAGGMVSTLYASADPVERLFYDPKAGLLYFLANEQLWELDPSAPTSATLVAGDGSGAGYTPTSGPVAALGTSLAGMRSVGAFANTGDATAPDGRLYFAQAGGNGATDFIRAFDPGSGTIEQIAGGTLEAFGQGASADGVQFGQITGLAPDRQGNLYVSTLDHAVAKVRPGGMIGISAGSPGTAGEPALGAFAHQTTIRDPQGLVGTASGRVWFSGIADAGGMELYTLHPYRLHFTCVLGGPGDVLPATLSASPAGPGGGGGGGDPLSPPPSWPEEDEPTICEQDIMKHKQPVNWSTPWGGTESITFSSQSGLAGTVVDVQPQTIQFLITLPDPLPSFDDTLETCFLALPGEQPGPGSTAPRVAAATITTCTGTHCEGVATTEATTGVTGVFTADKSQPDMEVPLKGQGEGEANSTVADYGADAEADKIWNSSSQSWEEPGVSADPHDVMCCGLNGNYADPVSLHDGAFTLGTIDLRVPGRGVDFVFQRNYNSRITANGPLGANWDSPFLSNLREVPGSADLQFIPGIGRSERFTWDAANSRFEAPPSQELKLKKTDVDNDGHNEFVVTDRFGNQRIYFDVLASPPVGRPSGRLMRTVGRLGNAMDFLYDAQDRLATIVDTLGRTYSLFYNAEGRIEELQDFTGRKITYGHDPRGNLVSVKYPQYTDGTGQATRDEVRYSYMTAPGTALDHNLCTVTQPEEVAHGGPPYLINRYGMDPGNTNTYDRVTSQYWGGTNDSGIPAGGEITYSYEDLLPNVDPDNAAQRIVLADSTIDPHAYDVVLTSDQDPANYSGLNVLTVDPLDLLIRDNSDINFEKKMDASGYRVLAYHIPKFRTVVKERAGHVSLLEFNASGMPLLELTYLEVPDATGVSCYRKVYTYDAQGNQKATRLPDGRIFRFEYDGNNADPFQRGNLLSEEHHADPVRGTGAAITGLTHASGTNSLVLEKSFTYDPVFNQVKTITDARGNSTAGGYQPQNGGALTPGRYTTTYFYDHEEATLNQDLNEDGVIDPKGVGLVYRIEAPSVGGVPTVTTFRYNQFAQLVETTDTRGNLTQLEYYPEQDPDGDGQDLTTGRDPTTGGYLFRTTADAGITPRRDPQAPAPEQVTSEVRYNRTGAIVGTTDGRGIEHTIQVNELNLPVLITAASFSPDPKAPALNYDTKIDYDHNRRVVRIGQENDNPLVPDGMGIWSGFAETETIYDILDNPVEIRVESTTVDTNGSQIPDNDLVTQLRYDPNERLVTTLRPEGNQTRQTYDALGRVTSITDAFGSPDEATVEMGYMPTGRLVETIAAEDTDNDGLKEKSVILYDGFGRPVLARNSIGVEAKTVLDPVGQPVLSETHGHPGGITPVAADTSQNVLLASSEILYDELGRPFETRALQTTVPTVTYVRPPVFQNQWSTSYAFYHPNGLVKQINEADGDKVFFEYDGLDRLLKSIDGVGNETIFKYDDNHNVVEIREDDKDTQTGQFETYITEQMLDAVNRVVERLVPGKLSYRNVYDSRSLLRATSDPEGPIVGSNNDHGNLRRFEHDLVGRLLSAETVLQVGGMGNGTWDTPNLDTSNPFNADGLIRHERRYDRNSNLVKEIDDNGNETTYTYDDRDRRKITTYADGTARTITFDRNSNPIEIADGRGVVISVGYDGANRVVGKSVLQKPVDVIGTTLQTFQWDGLGRIRQAFDNVEPGHATGATSTFAWDTLGNLLEESQSYLSQSAIVSNQYDDDGSPIQTRYPTRKVVTRGFDENDRLHTLTEDNGAGPMNPSLTRDYIGNRVSTSVYGNGVTEVNGYDSARRLLDRTATNTGGQKVMSLAYTYNRASMPTTLTRNHLETAPASGIAPVDVFTLDSAYRVTHFARDAEDTSGTNPRTTRAYGLDGLTNWRELTVDGVTSPNAVNDMNEYTTFDGDTITHDDVGSLEEDGDHTYVWDAFSRLREVYTTDPIPEWVATYTYDAYSAFSLLEGAGRRIHREVNGSHLPSPYTETEVHYGYRLWQVVEECDDEDALTKEYTYASYIDEPVTLTLVDNPTSGTDTTYTYHQERHFSVAALTDSTGAVAELVTYSDAGEARFVDGSNQARAAQVIGSLTLFQGRRWDPESGLHCYRHRYYSGALGRFVARDPLEALTGERYLLPGLDPLGLWGGDYERRPLDSDGADGFGVSPTPAFDPAQVDMLIREIQERAARGKGIPSATLRSLPLPPGGTQDGLDAEVDRLALALWSFDQEVWWFEGCISISTRLIKHIRNVFHESEEDWGICENGIGHFYTEWEREWIDVTTEYFRFRLVARWTLFERFRHQAVLLEPITALDDPTQAWVLDPYWGASSGVIPYVEWAGGIEQVVSDPTKEDRRTSGLVRDRW